MSKMNVFLRTILSLVFLLPLLAYADNHSVEQGNKVYGVVYDENKDPLIGASIVVENTTRGTITNMDGEFSLTVNTGEILVVSYIGFVSQEFKIERGDESMEIILIEDSQFMDELVVIGYGTVQKKDLTGAIQTLSSNDLVKALPINPAEALNGRIGGVEVRKSTNRPGSDVSILIRGMNSINYSNEPLYVIDGTPTTSGMKFINPSDIESIDILKDISSSAIYGSRGANGVVIITTKGASKKEGVNISYDGYMGVKTATRIPDMIGNKGNGLEYVNYRTKLWEKKYGVSSLMREDFLTDDEKHRIKHGEYYDWLREVAQTGTISNHNLTVSAGSNKLSYSFGVGYTDDKGLVGNERFQRITINSGLEYNSDYFRSGVSMYGSINNRNEGANDALINAYFLPPIVSPYDNNGDLLFKVQPTSSRYNPFIDIQNTKRMNDATYTNINGFVEVLPFKNISLKSQISGQYDSYEAGNYFGTDTQARAGINSPVSSQSTGRNLNWTWDNIVTYNETLSNIHRFNFIGLLSVQKDTHKANSMGAEGLPYESDWYAIQTADKVMNVSSSYWESSLISLMGRLNYTLLDKYLVTVTTRYDGTSRLSSKNRWSVLPSVALGWHINNEDFMKDVDLISQLKLRIGYGKSGNNSVPHDVYLTKLAQSRYNFGSTGVNGFGVGGSKGNPNLKWEKTSELNIGLDFGLLNNRITGTVDVYNRKTEDLIFARSVSNLNGFNSVLDNIGTTGNKGIEMTLKSYNINKRDFTWQTDLTFSLNRNKIIDLYGDKKDDLGNRWFIGNPISVHYDFNFLGIWQEEEEELAKKYGQVPGHIKVEDVNGDFLLDERDYKIIGSPFPDWTAGMTNTFTYKNVDLSVYLYSRVGGVYSDDLVYMFTAWDNEHWNKIDVEYWTPENRSNKWPQVGAQSYHTQVISKVKGSFLKIQNIALGYTFNQPWSQKRNIKNIRVFANVQNPFTFTSYIGADPESIGESVYSQLSLYPITSSIGLNITF